MNMTFLMLKRMRIDPNTSITSRLLLLGQNSISKNVAAASCASYKHYTNGVRSSTPFSKLINKVSKTTLSNNNILNISKISKLPILGGGQKRSLFIQTMSTPNPESIKFLPGRPVLPSNSTNNSDNDDETTNSNNLNTGYYITKSEKEQIARSPLSKRIFQIEGIKSLYLGSDFITVTKYAETHWSHIQTLIFSAIMDHYASGKPAILDTPEITDTTILDDDDEVVAMIKELLETRIRPAVQEDGGDIHYVGFEESSGIVKVKLAGSCVGCPSSSATLKNGVENMMMHYIPEVTAVVALEEEEEENSNNSAEVKEEEEAKKKMSSYEERLAKAGIPFSD